MKKLFDPKLTKESWSLFFILGIIMLNYPFIHIFNKTGLVFGIPILVVYFFVGWPLSILVIYWFCCFLRPDRTDQSDRNEPGENSTGRKEHQ